MTSFDARAQAKALLMQQIAPASLKPGPGDVERVFAPRIVDRARAHYQALWQHAPAWPRRNDQTQLTVWAASVADLSAMRVAAFPVGYALIARDLRPETVWVCWELRAPLSTSGAFFEGLVWIGGRWVWFPSPWRVLETKITGPAAAVRSS